MSIIKTGITINRSCNLAINKRCFHSIRVRTVAGDAGIDKKILASGATAIIIFNVEMEDIMKIVKSLVNFSLILKGVSETIQNEKEGRKMRIF